MEGTHTPTTPRSDLIDVDMDDAEPVRVTSPVKSSQDTLRLSSPPLVPRSPKNPLVSDSRAFRDVNERMKPNRPKANHTQRRAPGELARDVESMPETVPYQESALNLRTHDKGEDLSVNPGVVYISSDDESAVSSRSSKPGQNSFFPMNGLTDQSGSQRHAPRDLGSSTLTPKRKQPEVIDIDEESPPGVSGTSKADLYTSLLGYIEESGDEGSREQRRQLDDEKSPYFSDGVERRGHTRNALEHRDVEMTDVRPVQESLTRDGRYAETNSGRPRQLQQNSRQTRIAFANVERGRPSSGDEDNSFDELQGPATVANSIETRSDGTKGRASGRALPKEREDALEIPDSPEQEGPKSASDIPTTTFSSDGKKRASKAKGTNTKEYNFPLKSLKSSHDQLPFIGPNLHIEFDSESKSFQAVENGRPIPLDPPLAFDKIGACIWSDDKDNCLARLTGSRLRETNLYFHLEFVHQKSVRRFAKIAAAQTGVTEMRKGGWELFLICSQESQLTVHSNELRRVVENVQNRSPKSNPNSTADPKEISLLEHRTSQAHRPSSARRSTLVSQMQAEEAGPGKEPRIRYEDDTANIREGRTRSTSLREDTSGMRTRRMAKRDLSPESASNNIAESERPSVKYDLGEPWKEPIVYPPSAKKQITVYQENLKALDEGEWLNDNIIEFYILWLQEMIEVPQHQMYIFPTHFYTRLTEKDPSRPSLPINYANVERWTTRAKVDIFAYDFVLMPINEGSHWYVAIICNLPNLKRTLALEYDAGGDQGAKHEPEGFIDGGVDRRRDNANYASQRRTNRYEDHSNSELSVQYSQMSIKDQRSAAPNLGKHPYDTDAMDVDNEETKPNPPAGNRPSSSSSVRPGTPTTSPAPRSQRTPSSAIGVFQGAKTSPRMSNKSRKRSGPGRRKYDPSLPAIVILDSLHWDHHPAIGRIKDYLIMEALSKRSLTIERKDLQGLHVKEGISKQDNFNDCGLYMLGFIQKFMDDPKKFARKCLQNDFDESTDWPNMMPNEMRSGIRGELLKIHDEQNKAKEEKRRNKKAAKKAEKQTAVQSSQPSPRKDPIPTSPTEPPVLNKDLHPQVVIDTPAAFAPKASSPVKKSAQELQTQMDTNSKAPASDPFVDSMKGTTEQNQENSDVMLLDEELLTEVFATERDRSEPATNETGDANSRGTLEALGLKQRPAQGTSDNHEADEPSMEETRRPKTRGKGI